MKHKKCPVCGGERTTKNTNRSLGARDGLQPYCQSCERAYLANYRSENRTANLARLREKE